VKGKMEMEWKWKTTNSPCNIWGGGRRIIS